MQSIRKMSSVASAVKKHDALQELALKENCILVDENDKVTGHTSKRDCHRVSENGRVKLHRAFSVFLFNSDGDMLVQRRSEHKVGRVLQIVFFVGNSLQRIPFTFQITFPDRYTNACCSHPLFDITEEREESNAIGIRKAAQRRLNYELGVPYDQVIIFSLKSLRILWFSACKVCTSLRLSTGFQGSDAFER